ncbi:DegV family protein [uncultured Clostridium sp.]|uniref:DegV family protein n=1 Tax=uncultured Clostridium sp. TaxID=59620 RepID=UPI0025CC8DA8|nr:DegV family protein [uncultured Clostridium sp.]MDU4884468.1 DegV family protein [Clostridium celatum]MDU7077637.1 DegV family protein [Clostridium celatum]
MIKIVADSSSLYSKSEGSEKGVIVAPLIVSINGHTYKEFEDIRTEEFIDIINKGHIPSSSQPSIGEVLDIYDQYPDDEIINISMADGLSGTYNSACVAKGMASNPERIEVINSKTLCGPHKYLVNLAIELVKQGKTKKEIVDEINKTLEDTQSYLIPHDFDFLVRGGRISSLVGKIGSAIKLVPVMKLAENKQSLVKFTTKRTFKKAIAKIVEEMIEYGVDSNCKIYISHACIENLVEEAKNIILNNIENADIEINLLSPAFTTQGGPGCVAIQYIRKHELLK